MARGKVRISERTRQAPRELSAQTGLSMQAILDRAIEDYRRRRFLEEVNKQLARLRSDPVAWADEVAERELWDATLVDGIDD